MNTKDFTFELPESQIAQFPADTRGNDKLMHLNRSTGAVSDYTMNDLPSLIEPGTLMVFNNSKVRRARIFGTATDTGKVCEFLLIANQGDSTWRVMAKNAKRQRIGRRYSFSSDVEAEIIGGEAEFRLLKFSKPIDDAWLESYGHIPLPPYIRRGDVSFDGDRYQTVYAKNVGSVAAPTAGLHFTEPLLASLASRGIETAFVTLHVGLGTFLPVRVDKIEDHVMHEEVYTVPPETAAAVNKAKREGRPVLAVGTTSVRTLESAWNASASELTAGDGSTSIFIYPGYSFNVVDSLFTNFHTPESTLLMLVSAFAGKEHILSAYKYAVDHAYRFFSYGDAMLIK